MINSKNIFLIDGIGALISSIFLGIILPYFNPYFSLPIDILYSLSLVAVCFAVYSITCHYKAHSNSRNLLLIIAILNCFYGLSTLLILFIYKELITIFDYVYFIIELFILLALIIIEVNIWKRFKKM